MWEEEEEEAQPDQTSNALARNSLKLPHVKEEQTGFAPLSGLFPRSVATTKEASAKYKCPFSAECTF